MSAHDATRRLHARAADLARGWRPVAPDHVDPAEYARSPAASAVAELAAASGLFHFHFERRAHPPLPDGWVPPHDGSLADPPAWDNGVLPERKYQSFRHDLMIASFHPHHRAKWSTHELCHGLVGFAWAPDATPFFHATASRLAELLPVALWYFFDEAFLRRCPDHLGAGALFRALCPACEAVAAADPDQPDAERFVTDGLAFIDAELAAIARTRRLGRPISHHWATIDLCSDGLAYARAHAARLDSPGFRAWADRALVAGGGWSPDLDTLEARVLAVRDGVLLGGPVAPWAPSPAHGRWRWILQDLAMQVATVWEQCEGELAEALEGALDDLGASIHATTVPEVDPEPAARATVDAVFDLWTALAAEWDTPPAADVFAVGYPTPAPGSSHDDLLAAGLASCMPLTTAALEGRLHGLIQRFAEPTPWRRAHIADRFVSFLADVASPALRDLARWEAALARLPPGPPQHLAGPAVAGHRLGDHVAVLQFDHDVLAIAEGVESGELDVDDALGLVSHRGHTILPAPTALLLSRDRAGEIVILDVDPDTARRLAERPAPVEDHVDADELLAMAETDMLVPLAWAERDDDA